MPAGAATPGIGPIDVSQLIGKPENIVEPRNVALLSDAFRQGVISSSDIIDRIGELGKTKQKAELQQAQEAISPEAQALRAQQTAAGTAGAKLQEAQALKQKVYSDYPAVKYFDTLAPAAGIAEPKLADGSPDYQQMEKIGAQLAVHQARRAEAQKALDNIEDVTQGNTIFSKTKQGEIVDQTYVQNLRKQATAPFQQQAPGTVQTSAAPADAMMNGPASVAPAPLVEPRATPAPTAAPMIQAPTAETAPAGTRVGVGTSLGPLPGKPLKEVDPVERALAVQKAKDQIPIVDAAIAAVNRAEAVGPAKGSFPAQIKNRIASIFGDDVAYNDQRTLEMAISSKILEGAQVMKGNLSDKDVNFLKNTVPKLTDTQEKWNEYLNRWKSMAQASADILEGKIPKPEGDLFAPKDWISPSDAAAREAGGNLIGMPAAAAPGSANNPVSVNTPAEAPPTAQFIKAPDGRVFKNPNYRP